MEVATTSDHPWLNDESWLSMSDESDYLSMPKSKLTASMFCERESQLERPVSPDCLKLDLPTLPLDERPLVVDPRWLNCWGEQTLV
jgi:hypothetical protein